MSDPRDGFEVLAEVSQGQAEAGYFRIITGDNGIRGWGYWSGSQAVTNYGKFAFDLIVPDSQGTTIGSVGGSFEYVLPRWVHDRWFTAVYSYGSGAQLWYSFDLLTWTTCTPDAAAADADGFRDIKFPTYDAASGLFWVLAQSYDGSLPDNATEHPSVDLFYTADPGDGWTLGDTPTTGMPDAGDQVSANWFYHPQMCGSQPGGIYAIYFVKHTPESGLVNGNFTGVVHPDFPDYPNWYEAFLMDIIFANADGVEGPWTQTLLYRARVLDAPGAPFNYLVKETSFPGSDIQNLSAFVLMGGYFFKAGNGSRWVFFYDTDPDPFFYVSDNPQMDGDWTKIDEQLPGTVGMASLDEDGVLAFSVFDENFHWSGYAGNSLASLQEIDLGVSGPLAYLEIDYIGYDEWLAYCYPDDEDEWPEIFLIPAGGGGWGISLA